MERFNLKCFKHMYVVLVLYWGPIHGIIIVRENNSPSWDTL